MRKSFILITAALVLSACATGGRTAVERSRQKAAEVAEAVETRHFTVSVRTAYPTGGAAVPVAGDYSLELRGDSVVSYLPYFGRGYTLPYGRGKGLNFTAEATGYAVGRGGKDMSRIEFDVKNDEDFYKFTVELFDNGQASIYVIPQQRTRIAYSGEIE